MDDDIEKLAQQALGLDAQGNLLPGTDLEKVAAHQALADVTQRRQGGATGAPTTPGRTSTASKPGIPPRSLIPLGRPVPQTVFKTTPLDRLPPHLINPPARKPASRPPVPKRFQCDKCDRAFSRAYNLQTHQATHDSNPARSKPFICPYPRCQKDGGRSFSRKHDLQRHVASVHDKEQEPAIMLNPDGTAVALPDTPQIKHQETAPPNLILENSLQVLGLGVPGRRFRCESCGKAFVRRDALQRHRCDDKTDTEGESASGSKRSSSSSSPKKRNTSSAAAQQSAAVRRVRRPHGVSPQTAAAAAAAIAEASAANRARAAFQRSSLLAFGGGTNDDDEDEDDEEEEGRSADGSARIRPGSFAQGSEEEEDDDGSELEDMDDDEAERLAAQAMGQVMSSVATDGMIGGQDMSSASPSNAGSDFAGSTVTGADQPRPDPLGARISKASVYTTVSIVHLAEATSSSC